MLSNDSTIDSFKRGIYAATNGMCILEERRIPEQFGGGIVCRIETARLSWTQPTQYTIFSGLSYAKVRDELVTFLYHRAMGLPVQTVTRNVQFCLVCEQPYYPERGSRYCSHGCYMRLYNSKRRKSS